MKTMIHLMEKRVLPHMLMLSVFTGCTITAAPSPDDPTFAPVVSASSLIPSANPGGIYQPGFTRSLYEDSRANRVGDVLSVILSERTTSSKTADTDIKKDNSVTIDEATLLGRNVSMGGYSLATSLSQSRDFQGESASDQSNSLSGSIAVTISEILPNGLLVVRGEKWMTLNNGEEYIRVRGLVRPDDVQPDNTVLSTKLADARITYSGTGEFADSNKQGWASRFFNSVYWPF